MNYFLDNPIRVVFTKIDPQTQKLINKSQLVFVGNVPQNVLAEIKKMEENKTTKSQILKDYFGNKWRTKLGLIENKIGKAEDEEDFDIEELFEIETPIEPVEKKIEMIGKSRIIYDISIFPEDTIMEFKKKIYLASHGTNIETSIYQQHLCIIIGNLSIPQRYKIIAENIVNVNIIDMYKKAENNLLFDLIPIDEDLYKKRSQIEVKSFDNFITLRDNYLKTGEYVYYIFDIKDFIEGNKHFISNFKKEDQLQYNFIYYGFIVKYWPMMTLDVFNNYIDNKENIESLFPLLMPNYSSLSKKYKLEKDIIDKNYELKDDSFNSFNKDITNDPTMEVQVSLKNATIIVDKQKVFTKQFLGIWQTQLNIRNLFEVLEIEDNIILVKARLVYQGNDFVITKLKNKDISSYLLNYKFKYYNTIFIAVKVPAIVESDAYIGLLFFENGKYFIKVKWSENMKFNFDKTLELIKEVVNPFIDKINNFSYKVFDSRGRLNYISKANSQFQEININIYWKKLMVESVFNNMISKLDDYIKAGIISKRSNKFEYSFHKNIVSFDLMRLEYYDYIQNHYEYLSDIKINQKWTKLFNKGRYFKIHYRVSDIRVEVNNIKEKEFSVFFWYVINLFYYFSKSTKEFLPKDYSIGDVKKKLKRLIEKDPVAYNFDPPISDLRYATKCQKPDQPIIYSEIEYDYLPHEIKTKTIKYWNFTTNSPAYFLCPNKRNPNMSFITGIHPKNYCLACCKITSLDKVKKSSKKSLVYDTCIKNHKYKTEIYDEETTSRYIMEYGKNIEENRISYLPDQLKKIFLIRGDMKLESVKTPNLYIAGVKQESAFEYRSLMIIFSIVLSLSQRDLVMLVVGEIKKNKQIFDKIPKQFIKNIKSADELAGILLNIYSAEIYIYDKYINNILINLIKIIFGIYTILIEDKSIDIVEDNIELELLLPNKISNITNITGYNQKYLLVIKKRDQLNHKNFVYYPIFLIKPQNFFRFRKFEKMLFFKNDYIINFFLKMIEEKISKESINNKFDYIAVKSFCDSYGYSINKKFINQQNNCYALLLKNKLGKNVYVPIQSSVIEHSSNDIIFDPKKDKVDHQDFEQFIVDFNKYIKEINQSAETIRIFIVLDIKKYLEYDGKFVGAEINGLYFYFSDVNKSSILTEKPVKKLNYHPFDINKEIIEGKNIINKMITDKYKSYLFTYSYNLFLLQLLYYFDTKKNIEIRDKIKELFWKIDLRTNYDLFIGEICKVINSADVDKIKTQLDIYYFTSFDKRKFIYIFDKISYNFDQKVLYDFLDKGDKELFNELYKISKTIFDICKTEEVIDKKISKNLKENPELVTINNILVSCYDKNEFYCNDKKMIICHDMLVDYINIVISQFKNPITRQRMLSFSNVIKNIEFFNFKKNIGETIYISQV
jgi:hypothetical protein